ncbi:hypothetical protein BV25DRAFT_1874160 [Artomyces pyxidatus]|uniref:Uncharacterized protein n=1 Tax=Artomyces pyxidatus TaxID=48021 RepID=A0ACB8TKA9_9AGAM|nr:hypothetical protein BV25DRAFT_1874160 [Artomyces pyxidatus]
MSAPKTKSAPANGAKKTKDTVVSNGTPADAGADVSSKASTQHVGRPDKAAYDAEQEKIRGEIDAVQVKLSAVKEKISLVTKSGKGNDRRNALRAELDTLRGTQSGNKLARSKIIDQLKALQDGIQKKTKALQAARGKTGFRTVAEVDAHIRQHGCMVVSITYYRNLDKQVESGNMKLADEKRALQEITQSKRARKTVEGFQAETESIEADQAAADELRKQLDDPESKKISERYDAIKAELDDLKKESDEVYAGLNKLFDERNALQSQFDSFVNQRRDSSKRFREANDQYYAKVAEDRARRAERERAQRAAEEEEKKKALAERLREEAAEPAYQVQIEDCQTLIDHFSGKSSGPPAVSTSTPAEVAGEPKLDIRKVEAGPEGVIVRKKKGEDEPSYFVGKGKSKGKKGGQKANGSAAAEHAAPASTNVNVSLPILSALLSLSIPPPASSTDIPRVVEDLKTKKAWFEANQARATADAVAKAEKEIARLTKSKGEPKDAAASPTDVVPPNGAGENPAEPAPTPQAVDLPSTTLPSDEVVEKLENVEEDAEEA